MDLLHYTQRDLVMITSRMNKTRMAPVEVNGLYPPTFSLMLNSSFFPGISITYVLVSSLDWVKRHEFLPLCT